MKTLELKFGNEDDKIVTITVDNPIEPADPVAINAAMDSIIAQQAFYSAGGELTSKKSARIVERNVEEITL